MNQVTATMGSLIVFLLAMLVINRHNFGVKSFEEFATANRVFGFFGITFGVIATWWVGATFCAWAGMAVNNGMVAFYGLVYQTICMYVGFIVGEKTYLWGKRYTLQSQADLLGMRYESKIVGLIIGIAGLVFTIPWLLMEWVVQGYIFNYASGGAIPATMGMVIGVVVVLIYVALGGMKSVITANIVQGILMFFGGGLLMVWLVYHFFGGFGPAFAQILSESPEIFTFPGAGWGENAPPTLWYLSITITSGCGGFMWPWAYYKLFAADSIRTIKKSMLLVPLLAFFFYTTLCYTGNSLHLFPFAAEHFEEAFLWASSQAGIWPLCLMAVIIMAASIGTSSSIIHAMGITISKDIAPVIKNDINLVTIRSSLIGNLPSTVPRSHIVGNPDNNICTIKSCRTPHFWIVTICTNQRS